MEQAQPGHEADPGVAGEMDQAQHEEQGGQEQAIDPTAVDPSAGDPNAGYLMGADGQFYPAYAASAAMMHGQGGDMGHMDPNAHWQHQGASHARMPPPALANGKRCCAAAQAKRAPARGIVRWRPGGEGGRDLLESPIRAASHSGCAACRWDG